MKTIINNKGETLSKGELQKELRGMYRPSFMQMYLDFHYDGHFENLSSEDKGTFIHEYIHFLQNISTPHGLYQSMFYYSVMVETYKTIQSSDTITLPICTIKDETLIKRRNILELGMGDNLLSCGTNTAVDMDKPINAVKKSCTIDGKEYPMMEVSLFLVDGTEKKFKLGSQIIKESMASMYQRIVDPDVKRADLPYNFVELYCKQYFPNIANDKEKLISICYISLFSMSPSNVLMTQLQYASKNIEKNGIELFDDFVKNSTITLANNRKINVVDFHDEIINKFKITLEKSLICVKLDYLDAVLERVRLSKGTVPIISVLYDESTTLLDRFLSLRDYLGTPYIYTPYGEYSYPESTLAKGNASYEILALIGHQALFQILSKKINFCPLYYMCKGTNMEKTECFEDKPWEGRDCPISVIAKAIGLNKVKIEIGKN